VIPAAVAGSVRSGSGGSSSSSQRWCSRTLTLAPKRHAVVRLAGRAKGDRLRLVPVCMCFGAAPRQRPDLPLSGHAEIGRVTITQSVSAPNRGPATKEKVMHAVVGMWDMDLSLKEG